MAWLKQKLGFLVGFGLLWATGASASDNDRVVVVSLPGGRAQEGFANTLSIQLLGAAEVERRSLPAAGSTGERLRAARELAAREHALLAVWAEEPLELSDGSRESVLYAVGQREGRALLEVVRVPGGQGPDMDRTLALKVREIVDELHRLHEQTPSEAMVAPPAEENPVRGRTALEVDLGAVARAERGTSLGQWGAALAVGPSLALDAIRLSGLAELRFFPPLTLSQAGAQVKFDELAPWLSLRGQLRAGVLWLGAQSGVGLGFTHADGQTQAGARGSASAHVLAWRTGIDAEVPLASNFGFAFGLELQINFRRQRFAVNAEPVVDLGRVVPMATLGLRLRM